MDSKVGSGTQLQTLLSYEEFEPMCTWQREDDQDVLVLHLPEFKKDQLRIQISNTGILKITGENVVDGKKRYRFQKEVKVTKDYDSNNIHAKFSQGKLRVTLPKKVITHPVPEPPAAVVTSLPQGGGGQIDNVNNADGKTMVPNMRAKVGKVLKSKEFTGVMVNVGFVVAAAFSIYVAYKYWTPYVQIDEE